MTKAILGSGVLQETNSQYVLTGPLPPLAIPTTLHDALMARLDQLGIAKRLAQWGATLGRTFTYDLLQAVSSLDASVVWRGLAELVEAKLLYQRGTLPHATFTFKHALIQDAAYQSLLRSTRQQYHYQIAQVLEERFPETVATQPELLAHHYAEAGYTDQAVGYWQRAGQQAVQRSAHVEAVAHFQKGLELLQTLPDTPERAQQELTLQIALGAPLIATKGYSAPEVGQAYSRARALCQQIGETPDLFRVLWGLTLYYVVRMELQTALELGEQCLHMAQRAQDSALLLQAHHALWPVMLWRGDFASAHHHVERGMALYDPAHHPAHTALYGGHNPGVCCRQFAAVILWMLGYPDQALAQSRSVLTLAQSLAHPFTQAVAHCFTAWLHGLCRESHAAKEQAEATMRLCAEQGVQQWLAWGTVLRGKALTDLGQLEEGMAQICEGLAAWRATGAPAQAEFLAMLAEGHRRIGQPEKGLPLLSEALAHVNQTEERRHEAELYRLQGDLLRAQSVANPTKAETCYQKALSIARHQLAKSLELRAATSLARLWQSQDRHQDAYDLLAPVYGWFTEGFETLDLQEAKVLLDELAE
jgi:predicted ATPase